MRKSALPPEPFDAVVLAGGASRRMGQDKPSLYVGELTLLDRVLASVAGAATVVVVGPPRQLPPYVLQVQEDPPGAGPVAALAAALPHLTAPTVVLLAADLPFVTPGTVDALLGELCAPFVSGPREEANGAHHSPTPGAGTAALLPDGAVLLDAGGREQYLCSAWDTAALRDADLTVDRMGRLVSQLSFARVTLPVVPGEVPPWTDVDTPADLRSARSRG